MTRPFKILVKDLKNFVRIEKVLFASGRGKKLSVSLWAGPNIKRYMVEHAHGETEFFLKAGDAVKRFNEI